MTLAASCLSHKLLHYDYACLSLCFSSQPKPQNTNNGRAAVECRFHNEEKVSQDQNNVSFHFLWVKVNSISVCRLLDYSPEQREDRSLLAVVDLRVTPLQNKAHLHA